MLVPLAAQEPADSKNGLEVSIWWKIDGVIKVWIWCKIIMEEEEQEEEYIAQYYNWLYSVNCMYIECT